MLKPSNEFQGFVALLEDICHNVAGTRVEAAKAQIDECKAELLKAKQIRKNKQGIQFRF